MNFRATIYGLGLGLLLVPHAACNNKSETPSQAVVSPTASEPIADAIPSDDALRARLDEVIDFTKGRHLSPQVNNAWQIVHGMLAFGSDLQLNDNGTLVPALEWTLAGGTFKGWNFTPGEKGLEAILEPGTKAGQGHEDQWLGYLSQAGMPLDHPIVVQGQTFKVSDLVSQAQWDVHDGMEATWTMMALGTYLPTDAKWMAKDGSEWTLERIIEMEAAQELSSSACGGSHRLYGMSSALKRHLAAGGELTGGWKAADDRIQSSIKAAKEFQQPDGGFSINFFERAARSPDISLRLNTTGHILEFLTMALTDEQLKEPWVTRSVVYLCGLMEDTRELSLECGGLYHAAHGLVLYRQRRFGARSADKAPGST